MAPRGKRLEPIHPGKYLREEFLKPLGLNANQLAHHLQVPAGRITQILNGERSITADTALRLSRFFGTSPQFWMNAQSHYELEMAEDAGAGEIAEKIQPYHAKVVEKKQSKKVKK